MGESYEKAEYSEEYWHELAFDQFEIIYDQRLTN